MSISEVTGKWRKELPTFLYRCEWKKYHDEYGLPYTRNYMAQLDTKGEGPKIQRIAGKVCYAKTDFLKWYRRREKSRNATGIIENRRSQQAKSKKAIKEVQDT